MSEEVSLVQRAQATQAERGCTKTTSRDGEADARQICHE